MLSKLNFRILRKLDEKVLVKYLNFELYYSFHKFFGFPLKKLDFFYTHRYHLNLENPTAFNEKIVYRQLFIKDRLLSIIVDKKAVRKYVKEKVGEKYLVPVLQVVDSFDEIDFNVLPDNYIIKVNHGSGRNILCKNGEMFCNNKKYNNKKEIKSIIKNWLTEKYRFQELICFVQPIKRKIIIEKLLINDKEKIPNDYKLVNIAEKLAADFTHMRVDLYTIGINIYFGELTPCHANAQDGFIPFHYDTYFGYRWINSNSLIRKDK